jgi:hypothetical protein
MARRRHGLRDAPPGGCALLACVLTACSGGDFTSATAAADAGSDVVGREDAGGADGASDGNIEPDAPPCDVTRSPKDEACVNTNARAVYVSPSGNDSTGDGTRENPFATITKAATVAKQVNKRHVIACAGTYASKVSFDGTRDGLAVHGSFTCGDWKHDTNAKVLVKPATGVALEVSGLTAGLLVEDITFTSEDATTPGSSSIAVFVATSQTVVFRRVAMNAGKGASATNATRTASNWSATGTMNGAVPSGTTGGDGGTATCVDATTSGGGKGGNGTALQTQGGTGTWSPAGTLDPTNNGQGGAGGFSCGDNRRGSNGAPLAAASSATRWGQLSATGWSSAAGENGRNGRPGQGGGGGGGLVANPPDPAVGGGGGGAGGCGGAGAPGGQGGGSSYAALFFQSTVTLEASVLTTSDAGKGGDGAAGEDGQNGGTGGAPGGTVCSGQRGGSGAGGGGGGGGSGGNSVGIGYVGTAPTKDGATTISTKSAGAGGSPGSGGGGVVGGPSATGTGKAGVAADVQDLT